MFFEGGDESETQQIGQQQRRKVLGRTQGGRFRVPFEPITENVIQNLQAQGFDFNAQGAGLPRTGVPFFTEGFVPETGQEPIQYRSELTGGRITYQIPTDMQQETAQIIYGKQPGESVSVPFGNLGMNALVSDIPTTAVGLNYITRAVEGIDPVLRSMNVVKRGGLYFTPSGFGVETKRGRRQMKNLFGLNMRPTTKQEFVQLAALRYAQQWNRAIKAARTLSKNIRLTPEQIDKKLENRRINQLPYQKASRQIKQFIKKYPGPTIDAKAQSKAQNINQFLNTFRTNSQNVTRAIQANIQNLPTEGIQYSSKANARFARLNEMRE